MRIKRGDYRSNEEWRKACKAVKKFNKSRKPQKPRAKTKSRKRTENECWWKKYKKYLKSDRWKGIRSHIILVRNGRCERCGSDIHLQVHHKHYRNVFKERMEDLELLCRKCHELEHKK